MMVELGDLGNYTIGFLKELAQCCKDDKALENLGRNPCEIVRMAAASNKGNSKENLEKLSHDHCWQVRCEVAENPKTSYETRKKLAVDDDVQVREVALQFLMKK